MRSISAILRIAREQFDARGQLGVYPRLAWFAATAAIAFGGASLIFTGKERSFCLEGLAGSLCVAALLLLTIWSTREARGSNIYQEAQIREMAAKSILKILESEPTLKPLTIEQEATVKDLMKRVSNSSGLGVLLNMREA